MILKRHTNIILDTDSYKPSHWLQMPPGVVNQFNYLESRGGEYQRTVFFGLQYILKEYLTQLVTVEDVEEAKLFFTAHGVPFNYEGWMRIATVLGGRIPLRLKALPEGTVTPTKVPLLTAEATDPESFWVVGWFETMLMRLWYPITVASLSYNTKQTIKQYLDVTGDPAGLPFKLHDFGSRGVSSRETAMVGGAAHLVNFQGSDTVVGIQMANEYYGSAMAGYSIPAAEHSTITAWGREGELDAYRNMLTQFGKPGAVFACVSDSYNVYEAVDKMWGDALRQMVIDSGATVVIRPDSGDPLFVVNTLLHTLDRRFGSKKNAKGYKVLNHVRLIQGDGVNPYTIGLILKSITMAGFSADNIAFGMGGGLLQQVNRDTLKFAFKCSSVTLDLGGGNLEMRDVFKDPVDDKGKTSKKGRIGTKVVDGQFVTCADYDPENALLPVFENGEILREYTFAEVRANAAK